MLTSPTAPGSSTLSQSPGSIVQTNTSNRIRLISHRLSAGFPSPAAVL